MKIKDAYETLTNKDLKKKYDDFLHESMKNNNEKSVVLIWGKRRNSEGLRIKNNIKWRYLSFACLILIAVSSMTYFLYSKHEKQNAEAQLKLNLKYEMINRKRMQDSIQQVQLKNKENEEFLERFDYVSQLSNGSKIVNVGGEYKPMGVYDHVGGKWGLLDHQNKIEIPLIYHKIKISNWSDKELVLSGNNSYSSIYRLNEGYFLRDNFMDSNGKYYAIKLSKNVVRIIDSKKNVKIDVEISEDRRPSIVNLSDGFYYDLGLKGNYYIANNNIYGIKNGVVYQVKKNETIVSNAEGNSVIVYNTNSELYYIHNIVLERIELFGLAIRSLA